MPKRSKIHGAWKTAANSGLTKNYIDEAFNHFVIVLVLFIC